MNTPTRLSFLPSQPIELELSPSKARAAASTSHAWSQVTSWLSSLFSPAPAPPFERNPSTLLYLQSLMHANLTANETRKLLHEAQCEQLAEYERYDGAVRDRPEQQLLKHAESALSPEARNALDSIAQASVKLGYMPTHSDDASNITLTIAQKLQQLTLQLFDLQNQLHEISTLKTRLEKELRVSRHAVTEIESTLRGPDAEAELVRVRMQTLQYVREAKQISVKMNEYQDRITALAKHVEDQQGRTIEDVKERELSLRRKREDVRKLEMSLGQFNGLPPDVNTSREEVKRAQAELDRWKRKREEMFERM